eukprot:snap_masked-scaffold_16-processed-gene-0.31-mRNA-1 protein AED:1.00 eAED:1.00 QI:0/-1/0/0/-1/1/1/0/326
MELVVLIHGFLGSSNDFNNFVEICRPKLNTVEFLSCRANNWNTRDGIRKGAERIFVEVCTYLEKTQNTFLTVSLVGHSLGGLYARYLTHKFHITDFYEHFNVFPGQFYTFQTPHLGFDLYRRYLGGSVGKKFGKIFCRTLKEILLLDEVKLEQCFLYKLTDEEHLKGMRLFNERVIYSNIKNDVAVLYPSSCLRHHEELEYVKKGGNSYFDLFWSSFGFRSHIFDKAKLECHDVYVNLTKHSVDKKTNYVSKPGKVHEQSVQCATLENMRKRLDSLCWTKYDAVFESLFAHVQIVSRTKFLQGRSVVEHFRDELYLCIKRKIITTN